MTSRMKAPWRRSATTMAAFLILVARVVAVDQTFCSPFNTGSDNQPLNYMFMSAGKCKDTCNGQGAFGVVQGLNCWCSNWAPGEQYPASMCDATCPGYPDEYCGADGLFGYIAEGPTPFGTLGDASNQQPQTTPSLLQASNIVALQATSVVVQTSVNIVVSTQMALPSPSSSKLQSSSSAKPTPVTFVQVVTVSGGVVTNYVTTIPTSPVFGSSEQDITTTNKEGLSNGAVAGITIGAVAGAALLGLVILFCCWKGRKNDSDGEGGMKRNTSVLSKVGLLRSGSTKPIASKQPPAIQTSGLSAGAAGPGPASAGTLGSDSQMSESRRSRPLFVDQRLNPNALFAQPNASRTSVGTLQDNQDYSRPLEIRNPD